MAPSIRSLRRSVLGGGVLLLLVLVGFFAYSRLKGLHFHIDLPGRLGADISQTADGFTWSQSSKGHTQFTIHASKLVQYKGDQAELHDVSITLYGPEGSGRTDKITGSHFLYDRKHGIATAQGPVEIDLASPAQAAPGSPAEAKAAVPAADSVPTTIHVKTSDVVFNQATGDAQTPAPVAFALTRATGDSVGATYNAKSGILVLEKDVHLTSSHDGNDAVVSAGHARLLRDTRQAYLTKATTLYQGGQSSSDDAVVSFRADGSAEKIDALGHVHLTTSAGQQLQAGTANIDLDHESQPLQAELRGGIVFFSDAKGDTMHGTAAEGTLHFADFGGKAKGPDGKPHKRQALEHAQFREAVNFLLQQRAVAGDPHGTATRQMQSSKLDVDFSPGTDGKSLANKAFAVGSAIVTLHDAPSNAPASSTTISGDQLVATIADGRQIERLDGKGSTKIVDSAQDGSTSTSTGDALHITFKTAGKTFKSTDEAAVKAAADAAPTRTAAATKSAASTVPGAAAGGNGAAQVDTALQQGNVTLVQIPALSTKPSSSEPPAPLHATAAQAEFHAADSMLRLTGDPHLSNGSLALAAVEVDYNRATGDAFARGDVRSTYLQESKPGVRADKAGSGSQTSTEPGPSLGGSGPIHITGDHAQVTRATNLSVFYGTAHTPARMWQGVNSVVAPVIELSKADGTLYAHGGAADRGAVVHAALSSARTAGKAVTSEAAAQPGKAGALAPGSVTRVAGETLRYSDKDHRADFHGSILAEQPTGVVHADDAQVFLTPATPADKSVEKAGSAELDRLIATGHVLITQPGRLGSGDKLVYTASDGRYVLTGTGKIPPRVSDVSRGTTTGTTLIFKSGDDSVEVSGTKSRTITDTRTPK